MEDIKDLLAISSREVGAFCVQLWEQNAPTALADPRCDDRLT